MNLDVLEFIENLHDFRHCVIHEVAFHSYTMPSNSGSGLLSPVGGRQHHLARSNCSSERGIVLSIFVMQP